MKRINIFYIFLILQVTAYAQIDRTKPPQPDPAPEIKIGTYETFQLENGLKVFVVENHKLPRVAYSLIFDNDPLYEGEFAGYVGIAGSLIGTATENRTKDELNQEVDFIGATLNASSSSVYAASLKKHNEKLLELMSDVVLNSKLTQDELEKVKKQSISSLMASLKDPDQISSRLNQVILYGNDHPYGEITTEESLSKIDLEICRDYYEKYYNPANAYLAVIGDITVKEVKPMLENYFESWSAKEVQKKSYHQPKAPESRKIVIHDRPESVQSVIKVTYPIDLMVGSPEVMKAQIMNIILGGSTYRLFQNLRETHGWTYGAYSRISSDRLVGKFEAATSVRNEVTDSAVVEILYEMERLKNEPVPEEELSRVKNYVSGNFALSLEKPETVARFAVNTARYDLPDDYYKNYLKRVSEINKEDVKQAANSFLKPEQTYVFVVGNASEISKSLANLPGTDEIQFIDENGNYYHPDEEKTELPKDLRVKDVIHNFVEAQGGREKLKSIQSIKMEMSMNMQGMTMNVRRFQETPDKFAMIVMMQGNMVQRQIMNGNKGISSGMQGQQEITGDDLEKLKLETTLNPELKYEEMGYEMELASVENVNGEKTYKIILTNPFGDKTVNYYSIESGLKLKSEQKVESQMGTIEQTTYFNDYKNVDGYVMPHSLTQEINGQAIEITVKEVKINPEIDDSVFEIK